MGFLPNDIGGCSHSSVAHFDGLSLYMSAASYQGGVRLNAVGDFQSASMRLTAAQARLLAAELVAAADSMAPSVKVTLEVA